MQKDTEICTSRTERRLWSRFTSEGTVAHGETTSAQQSKKWGAAKGKKHVLILSPALPVVPPKGRKITCSEGTGGWGCGGELSQTQVVLPLRVFFSISKYRDRGLEVYIQCNKLNSVKFPNLRLFFCPRHLDNKRINRNLCSKTWNNYLPLSKSWEKKEKPSLLLSSCSHHVYPRYKQACTLWIGQYPTTMGIKKIITC